MKKKNIIIGSICLVAVIMGACGTQDKKNMQDNIQAMENSSHKSAERAVSETEIKTAGNIERSLYRQRKLLLQKRLGDRQQLYVSS